MIMELSIQAKGYLKEAAKWANIISIIGFIAIGFLIIASFTIGSIMAEAPEGFASMISPKFLSFFYLIMAGVYFIPVFFLFQFAQKTKQALIDNDSKLLTFGLKKLMSHYKYIGIVMIIGIVLYFILIFFGAIGAAAMM